MIRNSPILDPICPCQTKHYLFSRQMRDLLLAILLNTLAACRRCLAVITDIFLFINAFHWTDKCDVLTNLDCLDMVIRRRSSLAVVFLVRPNRGNLFPQPVAQWHDQTLYIVRTLQSSWIDSLALDIWWHLRRIIWALWLSEKSLYLAKTYS